MKRRVSALALILLVAVTWSGCISRPVVSGPALDFTLNSLDGDTTTLSNMKGQVVVLAINVEESRDEVAEFIAEHDYTLTVLLDTDGRVTDAYSVQGIPHTVIVDREGEVHYVLGGSNDVESTLRRLMAD